MTRIEHIRWCKKRAIQEFDFYAKSNISEAVRNGLTSMMSDINKHNETKSDALQMLCLMQMNIIHSRQEFIKFIEGFN